MGKWLEMLKAESGESHNIEVPESLTTDATNATKPKQANLNTVISISSKAPPLDPASKEAIQTAMERACTGLKILPKEFREMIEDDEATWCASGRIPIKTARAYAKLFAGELAQDGLHAVNMGMVTCWSCTNYRGKRCSKRRTPHEDLWRRCGSYQEVPE